MKPWAYYNEYDEKAAAWLRALIALRLIADGEVDTRSIVDVRILDLRGFTQCHFFAGIGGWSYALRLAGWPDDMPVWTGSCPCQPWSSASRGRGRREQSPLDLWPAWRPLIAAGRPETVFGEQVAQSGGWIDRLCDDMEALEYCIGAAILPACSVGLDHARPRIYFACDTNRQGQSGIAINEEVARVQRHRRDTRNVARAYGFPSRVALLRGYGNAIVPQLGAEFIRAYCEVRGLTWV